MVFVTAFSGLFAPYWVDDALGTICRSSESSTQSNLTHLLVGLTQYTTKEHIARATIEAVCFQTRAILDAMARDSGTALSMLAVDGGMSSSDESMQIQADILGVSSDATCYHSRLTACGGLEIDRPQMRETTALGAAIAAGFAVGVWKDFADLKGINRDGRTTFRPTTTEASREKLYANWERAVEHSKGWLNNDRADDGEDE